MKTQVGIVGAGPAGLFLSLLLQREGIDCVVLESHSRDYVESRVRAGVLEQGTVDLISDLGVDERFRRECMIDEGLDLRFQGRVVHMNLPELTGKRVHIYGQQEIVKDLIAARIASGAPLLFEAEATRIDGIDTDKPVIHFTHEGKAQTLTCDFVAGCDGFHGVSRPAMPPGVLKTYDHEFPFSWLGILSESPPLKEMTYANHDRGYALCSRRTPKIARLYLQCPNGDVLENWSEDRIWSELHIRLGDPDKTELKEGRIFQKNIAPCRSFVSEPMQHGRLFLAGDAAHIVPPTGAKGLNLAVADVRMLSRALIAHFKKNDNSRLERYTEICLRRIWKVVRYSTLMTNLLHRFDHSEFERRLQLAELDYIANSRAGATTIAENYVGLPYEDD